MKYKNNQYKRVEIIINKEPWVFNGDIGNGIFRGKNYSFILQEANNNLYKPILNDCKKYFKENMITWWCGRMTSHTLSSQIACLNHLFLLRNDKQAVLKIIQRIAPDIVEVLPLETDKTKGYIQFEAVSDVDHMNENSVTRGINCTSIDALIYGLHKDGTKVIFPIEWKYTESYGNTNKAQGEKGKERLQRYTDLISQSKQLVSKDAKIYYYEPFYQLMRQTIWAEQIIKNKSEERIQADDYVHIHVIPCDNDNLLNKKYVCSQKNMEATWRSCIKNQEKYVCLSPNDFLKPILNESRYSEFVKYLQTRYWNPICIELM